MINIRIDEFLLEAPLPGGIPSKKIGGKKIEFQLSPCGNILDTLDEYGISLVRPVSAVINGQAADLAQELKSGDEIYLLAQIAGGD